MKQKFSKSWGRGLSEGNFKRTTRSFSPGKIMGEIHIRGIDNYILLEKFQKLDNKSKIYLLSQYVIENHIDIFLDEISKDQDIINTIKSKNHFDKVILINAIVKAFLEELIISKEISEDVVNEFSEALRKDSVNESSAFKDHESRKTGSLIHGLLDGLTVGMMAINIAKNTFGENKELFEELKSEIVKICKQLAYMNINVFRYVLHNILDGDNLTAHFKDEVFQIVETKDGKKIEPRVSGIIDYEKTKDDITLFCPAAFGTSIEKLFEIMK